MTDAATLDEHDVDPYEYDDCDVDYDAREYFGLDPNCSDEEVEEHERAYAEDCYAEEQIEEWKIQRHLADERRLRLTGAWRVRTLACRPLTRARSSRPRRRVRRTARTVSSRGDPDDPEPAGGRRPGEHDDHERDHLRRTA